MKFEFHQEALAAPEQALVKEGFRVDSERLSAPQYLKQRIKWLGTDADGAIEAALAADVLWDWLYVDELWVCSKARGNGVGRQLMGMAEDYAVAQRLSGIWLWTQSWQAEGFYRRLGYREFARFDDFPKGFARIGFRKRFP